MAVRSLFTYGQTRELTGHLPVTPEELEFLAGQQIIIIVPNFSLKEYTESKWLCIGAQYGPFQPNFPIEVPIWLAVTLHSRKLCRVLPPTWLEKAKLTEVLEDEQHIPGVFQALPFFYVEIAKILFEKCVDAFGSGFGEVKALLEQVRVARYNKIKSGLKKVGSAMTVKLNNLSATETNMIRGLFKGTLDVYLQLSQTGVEGRHSIDEAMQRRTYENDGLYQEQASLPPDSLPLEL